MKNQCSHFWRPGIKTCESVSMDKPYQLRRTPGFRPNSGILIQETSEHGLKMQQCHRDACKQKLGKGEGNISCHLLYLAIDKSSPPFVVYEETKLSKLTSTTFAVLRSAHTKELNSYMSILDPKIDNLSQSDDNHHLFTPIRQTYDVGNLKLIENTSC